MTVLFGTNTSASLTTLGEAHRVVALALRGGDRSGRLRGVERSHVRPRHDHVGGTQHARDAAKRRVGGQGFAAHHLRHRFHRSGRPHDDLAKRVGPGDSAGAEPGTEHHHQKRPRPPADPGVGAPSHPSSGTTCRVSRSESSSTVPNHWWTQAPSLREARSLGHPQPEGPSTTPWNRRDSRARSS